MKIYFAYRSGYIPNHRHLRVFEADSVLDWFVQNWPVLSERPDQEEHSESEEEGALALFLGEQPYGLPLSDVADEGEKPARIAAPRNLKELKEKVESFAYCGEVLVAKNCVQVLTDDDEIELAWYVFDEEYARANAAKVAIWLHADLPLQAEGALEPQKPLKSKKILPAGAGRGRVYWMASAIHDSLNLDDLEGAFCIEGVTLPGLLDHLRHSDTVSMRSEALCGLPDIRLFQRLCKLLPSLDQEQLFAQWSRCPGTKLDTVAPEDISNLTLEDVRRIQDPEAGSDSSRIICGENLVEVITDNGGFYDYLVLFDDVWLAANPQLGHSLARFCSTWKI